MAAPVTRPAPDISHALGVDAVTTLHAIAGNRAVSALVTARRSGGASDTQPRLRAGFGIQRAPSQSAGFPSAVRLEPLPSKMSGHPPGVAVADQTALGLEISKIVSSADTSQDQQALRDASAGIDLVERLNAQHWESERARRLYTKAYLIASEKLAGRGLPGNDQLHFALVGYEQRYRASLERTSQEREAQTATAAVRAKAASNQMPTADFEPGFVNVPVSGNLEAMLSVARTDARWCDDGIVRAGAKIDPNTGAQSLRVTYNDGAVLDIPLRGTVFRHGLPQETAPQLRFRRHKGSGRLIPFETTLAEYGMLAAPAASHDDVEYAIPPRFDPVLTPHIIAWFEIANNESMGRQFGVAAVGVGAIATASGGTRLVPGASKVGTALTETAVGTVVGAGRLAGAGLAEIRFAVAEYKVSTAALAYLGRSALTFYLRNAVTVSATTIFATEFALSMAGQDMGVVTPGDQLTFAVHTEKDAYVALRVEVEEVDRSAQLIKVKRLSMGTISEGAAEEIYGSGKLVHHEKAPIGPRSGQVPKTAAAADQPRPPVVPAGKQPAAPVSEAPPARVAEPPKGAPPNRPRYQQEQPVGVRIREPERSPAGKQPEREPNRPFEQQHQQQQSGTTRDARTRARQSDRYAGGAEFGLEREQVDELRRQIIKRQRVGPPPAAGQAARPDQLDLSKLAADHRGAGSHFDLTNPAEVEIILHTINDPQAILVSRNGSWIFFGNGRVVVTERGAANVVRTAYGRGAHVPGRRINQVRQADPTKRVGDPEDPVSLKELLENTGAPDFDAFTIWP